MNQRRERLRVIYDILKAIQDKDGKIKPTHILYKANLSHGMLEEYLAELKAKGLLVELGSEDAKTYSLTEKGHEYIQKYGFVIEFMESFGLNE